VSQTSVKSKLTSDSDADRNILIRKFLNSNSCLWWEPKSP
jgi:hypothetical protein